MNSAAKTNQELRETAARMVTEWDELPAGSVLRFYSRAVRTAVLAGCSPPRVPAVAERIARVWLDLRVRSSAAAGDPETLGVRVLRQRTEGAVA